MTFITPGEFAQKHDDVLKGSMNESWEQRFRRFYFEQGEYARRPLGLDQYINFISQELDKARESGRQEKLDHFSVLLEKDLKDMGKQEERTRILKLIEEMKPWGIGAVERWIDKEALTNKINENSHKDE